MAGIYTAAPIWEFADSYLRSRNPLHPFSRQPFPGVLSPGSVWFFMYDELRFLSMGLPTMLLLAEVHRIMERFCPETVMDAIHGMGARSIYIYVLHWPISTPCIYTFTKLVSAPPYAVAAVFK